MRLRVSKVSLLGRLGLRQPPRRPGRFRGAQSYRIPGMRMVLFPKMTTSVWERNLRCKQQQYLAHLIAGLVYMTCSQ